ncbi:hypothetical protein [Burkholderia gladioli]|uniref:hypothetical protein n=1 Tax=Burkholderia gladioli TaxID=28095 RepID=UPI0015E63BBF|nr:hypothetical protein [Burkholderia gladioli]
MPETHTRHTSTSRLTMRGRADLSVEKAIQTATLTQQMRSVQPFADLDRGFAEMRVRSESVREDVRLLWTRSQAEERDRGIVRRPSGRAGSAKLVSPASRRNSARTLRF